MGNDALNAENLLQIFTNPAFQSILQLFQKPLLDKIEKLEEKNNELFMKIKEIENAAEKFMKTKEEVQETVQEIKTKFEAKIVSQQSTHQEKEKAERINNIVITGYPETEGEELKKSLTEFFESKFERKQIALDCCRMGPKASKEEQNTDIKPRPIKVRFNSVWDQRTIYGNRIQNLKKTGIFINEDLSPENSKKSFIARKLKREKKIFNTYTNEGTVYVKTSEFAEPEVFTHKLIKKLTIKDAQEGFMSCANSENVLLSENKGTTSKTAPEENRTNTKEDNNKF